MCGIAGFVQPGLQEQEAQAVLARMLDTIAHRGPDGQGRWLDLPAGVALGHRRLAVVDLSAAGHQPMASADGRFQIIFNGEIYNHVALRKQLECTGAMPPGGWRGHADTETLLACMAAWGVTPALQATVGMFALALWDRRERVLTLARDRLGEKPLYYGWQGNAFLFGSELKALRAHPRFEARPDWSAARGLLETACIPGPGSIWQGIAKLPPGCTLALHDSDVAGRQLPEPLSYWSLADSAQRGREQPFAGSYEDAVDQLEALVLQAVQLQSMADVPVGAFLSGGVDSSTVVAMMRKGVNARVTTFSIGMPDPSMDESAQAAAVARHLGTEHVARVIQPGEALALIPSLSRIWDEPFADSSQIPTWLVSRLARERVTVALSGDGGDELFLGYPQYPLLQKVWQLRPLAQLPWRSGLQALAAVDRRDRWGLLRKARIATEAWQQPDVFHLNHWWMNRFQQDPLPLRGPTRSAVVTGSLHRGAAETAALADAGHYLPDDILVKVDRAAMANSLETRAPLLDHRIVEFALALPLHYKLQGAAGKRVLRDVLYRHVPRALVDRPKMGFSIPLARWLRQELRPWAQDLLESVPAQSPLFDPQTLGDIWTGHLAGTRDRTEQLWPVLSLLAWCRHNGVQP
jgi:asparagine synthase (glutamine-hydrolysing)